ncbi:CHAP domain-containing protein [Sphingomonas sp. ac-8]|uniref:CHAP domain-containing protein n=1 Tax=Sphingomonas sp. ac-8 TaxID=3242977 RepID=UPI003A80ACAB
MFASLFRGALCLGVAAALPLSAGARTLLDYTGECVPFARTASGVQIYGDAWTWWDQAKGKYPRGHVPKVGAVLAMAKSARLPLGHVAVVSRVIEKRVLMITHANWSRIGGTRGQVERDVTLFDVSPNNDWTRVKVWYRDNEGLGGSEYPAHGFIYGDKPDHALSGDQPDYVGSLIDAYAR